MFDPVTNHARSVYWKKKRAGTLKLKGASSENMVCSLCNKKVERLFDGRCIACATRIAQGIFAHQIPESKIEKKIPKKKKIDTKVHKKHE
jgi:hypothetical protein